MTGTLSSIYRHPIKSHGREPLRSVALTAGQSLPWDRHWGVVHEAAKFDPAAVTWLPSVSFSRGSKAARLMAINATLDEATGQVTLTHPDLPTLTIDPESPADSARFIEWVRPISPPNRAQPARIVRAPGRGMTDTDYPSVSVINLASNRALSDEMGVDLSALRWRGNLWIDGLPAWSEFDWMGRTLQIGAVSLRIEERTTRCPATTANPQTGICDADTLSALKKAYGHQDFGVYAVVTVGGELRVGDRVQVI